MSDLVMGLTLGASLGSAWNSTISKAKDDISKLKQQIEVDKKNKGKIGQSQALQGVINNTQAEINQTQEALDVLGLKLETPPYRFIVTPPLKNQRSGLAS